MDSKIKIIFAISLIVIANTAVQSQCELPAIPEPSKKPRLARLFPSAIVDLPKGFSVFESSGHIDAWFGSISSLDGKFKINFSGGMVGSVFEKNKKELICKEVIKGFDFAVTIGIVKSGRNTIMLAGVFWAQFVATITSEEEKIQFLKIVSSYRREMSKSPEKPARQIK